MSRIRRMNLVVLGLLLVAIVAIACAKEEEVPTATVAPTETSQPTAFPTPTEVPPTTAPTPTATPEPVARPQPVVGEPTPAPLPGGEIRAVPPVASEVRIARPVPVPVRSATAQLVPIPLIGVLARPLSIDPTQQLGQAGGLTVLANGSVTMDADEAYVVVVPETFRGPGGPEPIPSKDRAEVIAKLAAMGIEEDKIEFESGRPYQPVSIVVEVEVEELPEAGERILDAVEDVLRRSQRSGVRFSLSEANCDRALALARQEAVPQAEKDAQVLAEALGVSQGDVIEGAEFLLSDFGYAPFISGCGGGAEQVNPYDVPLVPFDSNPEIEISILLQITYAIGFEEALGITVSASGSTEADADEVYVVLVPEQRYGPGGPEPISGKDRAEIIANLVAIGIAEDDIGFGSGQPYEPEVISVEVEMTDLPEIGERILDGVEDVLRRTEISGVRFSLSEANCDQALGLARQEAVPQAHKSAHDLADALGVDLNFISGAVEYQFSGFGSVPLGTRCGGGQSLSPYQVPLMPFDADPKVEISTQLQITYAIK